ncbi:MAG TPA: class I SAM-dependent RNA methyltransferase [Gemmatimonadaceae bacterium]|nr:class I SAM-dependent RNA methyltransferase [Gemmatimonadaceae bacterium]
MAKSRAKVPRGAPRGAPSKPAPRAERFEMFAICAPGLEDVLEAEMRALGLETGKRDIGGVSFSGGSSALYRANLWLRSATRVVARVGTFHARLFDELERHSRKLAWSRFIDGGQPVRLRVSTSKSRLYHSGAVAQRIAEAMEKSTGVAPTVTSGGDEDDETGETPLVIVRLFRDDCTVSIDTSGALLHRRGYRLATAKAPLRETLGAALLLASGWDPTTALVDPLCGAGTIPIEGAMIARRIPPGLSRSFAFMRWPGFHEPTWKKVVDEARAQILGDAPAPILGSDRDAGAIVASRANAERAGVAADIVFEEKVISRIAPPDGATAGSIVTNPPYGVRVGDRDALRNLYAQLGTIARDRFPGWRLTALSADPRLDSQIGGTMEKVLATKNGGIAVRAVRSTI